MYVWIGCLLRWTPLKDLEALIPYKRKCSHSETGKGNSLYCKRLNELIYKLCSSIYIYTETKRRVNEN